MYVVCSTGGRNHLSASSPNPGDLDSSLERARTVSRELEKKQSQTVVQMHLHQHVLIIEARCLLQKMSLTASLEVWNTIMPQLECLALRHSVSQVVLNVKRTYGMSNALRVLLADVASLFGAVEVSKGWLLSSLKVAIVLYHSFHIVSLFPYVRTWLAVCFNERRSVQAYLPLCTLLSAFG